MLRGRPFVLATAALALALASASCGRLGFHSTSTDGDASTDDAAPGDGTPSDADADALDQHLHAAAGWSIRPLVDLTGAVPFNGSDFTDGSTTMETLDNAPTRVAALYPPFTGELVVIAGRSLIETSTTGVIAVHDYRPAQPDTTGPDAPTELTFAALGAQAGLWMQSSSQGNGDGLFFIDASWALSVDNSDNNANALALDPLGAFEARGSATLYLINQIDELQYRTGSGTTSGLITLTSSVDDLAQLGNDLYATEEQGSGTSLSLVRIAPNLTVAPLTTATDIVLAEGSTDGGLYGIEDDSALGTFATTDGAFTQVAYTDDPAWQWRSVSVPRAGHALAGELIVVESNRALDRDRLLLVTPP